MNSNHDDEGMDLQDLLLGALLGKCPHEIQLGRTMAVLGAIVQRNGGPIELDMTEVIELNGRALKIEADGTTGKMTVALIDAPVDEPAKQPTHDAPPTRQ